MASKMNSTPTNLPTEPGFYWITELGMTPLIVEVVLSCVTDNALQVLLPGDSQRYPLDFWDNAFWYGPLVEPE